MIPPRAESKQSETMDTQTQPSSSAEEAALKRAHDDAEKLAESAYLQQQAEAARQALSRTAQELASKLSSSVDPRELTKDHPWLSLAAAAVGGFTAAAVAVPSRQQQALKRLKEMEEALGIGSNGNGHRRAEPDDNAGARQYARGDNSFWAGLGRQVLEAVKPALLSALTAGITAKTAKTKPEEVAAASSGVVNPGSTNPGSTNPGPSSPPPTSI
jgi:hypothetical protein